MKRATALGNNLLARPRSRDAESDLCWAVGERVTVAKLQVGLLGSARTLQKQLDRIASRADTNSPSGLHYILQGALQWLSV